MNRDVVNVDGGERLTSGFRRRHLRNSLAMALSDAVALAVALCVGNLMLKWLNGISFEIRAGWLLLPVWTTVSLMARLVPGWGLGTVDELRRIQQSLFVMFAVLLLGSFFARGGLGGSRIVFLFTYFFSAAGIPFSRIATRAACVRWGNWGIPVCIYGDAESTGTLIEALRSAPGLGYVPTAIFSDDIAQGTVIDGVPVLGGLRSVTRRVAVAIMALSQVPRRKLVETLEGPLEVYRRVIVVPDLKEAPSMWVVPRDLQGILGLEITKNLLNPMARFLKRFIDLALTLATLPLWLPLMLLLYVLIWLEDRANPIFLQPRLGRDRTVFKTIKFRTMVPNAERVLQHALRRDAALKTEWEAHFKLKNDPRITRVGNFLRKTSLDEIPQLLNVLGGSMSLVGPRPLPEYHYLELPSRVRFLRNQVRPGITGLWQVSGRSEAGTEGMEKWDPYYVRNWSIWLDVVILFRTVKAVLFARGAY